VVDLMHHVAKRAVRQVRRLRRDRQGSWSRGARGGGRRARCRVAAGISPVRSCGRLVSVGSRAGGGRRGAAGDLPAFVSLHASLRSALLDRLHPDCQPLSPVRQQELHHIPPRTEVAVHVPVGPHRKTAPAHLRPDHASDFQQVRRSVQRRGGAPRGARPAVPEEDPEDSAPDIIGCFGGAVGGGVRVVPKVVIEPLRVGAALFLCGIGVAKNLWGEDFSGRPCESA